MLLGSQDLAATRLTGHINDVYVRWSTGNRTGSRGFRWSTTPDAIRRIASKEKRLTQASIHECTLSD